MSSSPLPDVWVKVVGIPVISTTLAPRVHVGGSDAESAGFLDDRLRRLAVHADEPRCAAVIVQAREIERPVVVVFGDAEVPFVPGLEPGLKAPAAALPAQAVLHLDPGLVVPVATGPAPAVERVRHIDCQPLRDRLLPGSIPSHSKTQVVHESVPQHPVADLHGPLAVLVLDAPLGEREPSHAAVLGTARFVVEPDADAVVRSERKIGIDFQLALAFRPGDTVEHVARRRNGAQGIGRALSGAGGSFDVDIQTAGDHGAAQVEIEVPRLARRFRPLTRSGRVQGLVGEAEVDRSAPPARTGTRHDLDARALPASVGPQGRRVDDDLRNLVRPRQPPVVEAVDDEAGHVFRQVAGRIGPGEKEEVARQVFLVGRQRQQLIAGEHRGGQARQGIDPKVRFRIEDVDALFQHLQRQCHSQRLEVRPGANRLLDGLKGRRRHFNPIHSSRDREAEAALPVRHRRVDRFLGALREQLHGGRLHHAAGLVGDRADDGGGAGRLAWRGGPRRNARDERGREHDPDRRRSGRCHHLLPAARGLPTARR